MNAVVSLNEMAMGYFRSRVLCAAARLGVADALAGGAHGVAEIARVCEADADSLYRLLRALAAMGVTAETAPGEFVLTPFGGPLCRNSPNSVWSSVVFWSDLIAENWSYLTECVQTGDTAAQVMQQQGVQTRWSKDPNANAIFRAVMGTAPAEDYRPILNSWDFSRSRLVADLGGGGGSLISAILKAHPVMGMLVDRPDAIEAATARFEADGLTHRCQLLPSDLTVQVPTGADAYVMKHVLHGYKDDVAVKVLKNCHAVTPPDGYLLIIEAVLPILASKVDPATEARLMSDLNMMTVTGGKERSAAEWNQLLISAGFKLQRIIPVMGELSIIEARP